MDNIVSLIRSVAFDETTIENVLSPPNSSEEKFDFKFAVKFCPRHARGVLVEIMYYLRPLFCLRRTSTIRRTFTIFWVFSLGLILTTRERKNFTNS